MRNLLLLLVLINALLLAWQRWIVAPPVADPYAPQGGGDLPALLAYQRPAAPVAPASKAAPQVARACVAVGPFANPVAARRAAQLLTQRGMQLRLEQREAEVWLGHWVQITGFASRAQAASALKRLIAAGLGDAYIVRDGNRFLVSLGVFRSDGGTERTVARARAAGFEPVVRDRYRQATERWLLVEYPAGSPPRVGELAAVSGGILRLEARACEGGDDGPEAGNSLE